MHFLRSAILAFGIIGLAAACGSSNKGAEEPEAPMENPCAAEENPCDMGMEGEEGMGMDENPCAMEENPCAAEEGEGEEW